MGKTVIYAHGTPGDDLNGQIKNCTEYVSNELDTPIPPKYTTPPYTPDKNRELSEAADVTWIADATDDHPAALERVIEDARKGSITRVITPRLHTLSDSLRDCHDIIDQLHREDVTVHLVERAVSIKPLDREKRGLLFDAAKAETRANQRQIDPGGATKHTGGRPPVGYTVEGGYRRPAANYDEVEATLHDVVEGETSIHVAAGQLDVSRATIRNAVQKRSELYGLPEDAELPSQ